MSVFIYFKVHFNGFWLTSVLFQAVCSLLSSGSLLIHVCFQIRLFGSVTIKTLVFPSETSDSYVEMVPLKPLQLKAFTLCMRLATELKGEREVILFAYRTGDYDELNVWRELDGRLSFYLSGDGVFFQVPELGALKTHLCVTWDSSSGAATVFMDGRKSLTKIYKKGHTIRAGGKVLLGQDPDSYLGDYDAKQSFVGEVCDVNMWDSVLPDRTIKDLVSGKRVQRGNVFDWETIQLKISGTVEVIHREL
uniref:Pentraxin family member n=1 Tax=Amphiprion ocellaris TaxID=80972 RepID=A0AAQ5Z477_AMPOC